MEKKNNLDPQYNNLLKDILENGVKKQTRNGEVISVFGRQIRHKMSDGFPLLTGKKMFFKGIAVELLWFLRGNTNIKYLVDNDCHIWDGDAYKNYISTRLKISDINKSNPVVVDHFINNVWGTQKEFINRIKTDIEFAKTWGELGPIYGKQWREWSKINVETKPYIHKGETHFTFDIDNQPIDQIANLINELKTNPDSRRLMVNTWNVGELDQMVLPPCHYSFQVYTRELTFEERYVLYFERLDSTMVPLDIKVPNIHQYFTELNIPQRAISLMWNQRSVDTFLGLPFNIASYGLLLEIIAKVVNMVPDELIGNLGDVHLYSNHIEQAKEQITRTPYELPTLNINTEFWQTESGECGIGSLSTSGFISALSNDDFIRCLLEEDIQLGNYQSHPAIKAPLSN